MDDRPPRKRPSGAAFRRAAKGRERQEVLDRAKSLGIPVGDPTDADDGADLFAQLGPPPLDDPGTALAWVRKFQLLAMHVAATKPLTDSLRERIKYVREFGATIGMTHNRVEMEEAVQRCESLIEAARPKSAINTVPTSTLKRPPTARGGALDKGPQGIPGPQR